MTRALVLGLALGACSQPTKDSTMTQTKPPAGATSADDQLIAKVRAAVATRVVPEGVEEKVGERALVNTATGLPLEALAKVDFQADPEHPDERLVRAGAKAVIYWSRPVPGDDPHVVGIQVRADGTSTVFFAVVGPP